MIQREQPEEHPWAPSCCYFHNLHPQEMPAGGALAGVRHVVACLPVSSWVLCVSLCWLSRYFAPAQPKTLGHSGRVVRGGRIRCRTFPPICIVWRSEMVENCNKVTPYRCDLHAMRSILYGQAPEGHTGGICMKNGRSYTVAAVWSRFC